MLIHSLRGLCGAIFAALLLSIALGASQPAHAQQAYGPTDFIIADFRGSRIAVYDQGLMFKGYLDNNFVAATGLDFLCNGNLVATGQSSGPVKQYSPSGAFVSGFNDPRVGRPIDIKTSPADLLYIGTQSNSPMTFVAEFTLPGTYNRSFGSVGYAGVAVLPGGVLWAGGSSRPGFIDVFNINTGALITSITLDNLQSNAQSMFYSASTNTVLMTDISNGIVYERTTTGSFVRSFTAPGGSTNKYGVTRGPGGDVFATDFTNQKVYRFLANGTPVGTGTDISVSNGAPINIVWAGNIGAGCTTDTFLVNYFAGANGGRPDQSVRLTNTGTVTDPTGSTTSDLCANIYVFRNDQQQAECCSCLVTPNGLRTLSVDFDLAHNPLTPGAIGEGVIKIVSARVPTGGCTPATAASGYTPVPALRAWGTHNQDVSGGLQGSAINQVTETHFLDATLSLAELKSLQSNCAFINAQGSGHGICSCGRGD